MLMRVAIGIHKSDIDAAIATYDLMSRKIFTHASPTMFNAGTPKPQLSSCFLLTMTDDSIEGIYETLARTARISKAAGGIGLNVHCIRAAGSFIAGTNGNSNGLMPMLRVYNATARYVDQGESRRSIFLYFITINTFFFFSSQAEENAREHLPFILSLGMLTSLRCLS